MDNEQRLVELEQRRRRSARLLRAGVAQAEVARQVQVSRQSVMRWADTLERQGIKGLGRASRFGRPPRLSDAQLRELERHLKAGALAAGYATELWTLPRIGKLIEQHFGVRLVGSSVWRLLRRLGWSVQRPASRARQQDPQAVRTWKQKRWPQLKKARRGKDE